MLNYSINKMQNVGYQQQEGSCLFLLLFNNNNKNRQQSKTNLLGNCRDNDSGPLTGPAIRP